MNATSAPGLLLALFVFLAACTPAAEPADPALSGESPALPTDRPVHLFLLAGQSNMAGRGVVAAQDTVAHPRVWTLDRDGRWVPAVDPIHFDKPIAGVGPGRSFGLALAEWDSSITVGLVPCAVGGSPIETWTPGAVHEQTGAHPYDDALARARRAMQDGVLKAILWHQGESDSNAERAPLYAERLDALIARFRRDLGDPDLPFIVGQLGRFEGRPWDAWWMQVNEAHETLVERVPHTGYIGSSGLAHAGDSLHFDAASARELGRRYADVYLEMTAGE